MQHQPQEEKSNRLSVSELPSNDCGFTDPDRVLKADRYYEERYALEKPYS
jgi:hypothetical protein